MSQKGLKSFIQRAYLLTCTIMLVILVLALDTGCASVQKPMGGPRDTIAPTLLSATPKNNSLNFTAKRIVLNFSEYIKLQNQQKEVSLSPDLEEAPIIKERGKRIEVTFTKPLEKNTTYTLNFGNSIADVNESNKLKNFKYVFATGNKIDSLYVGGTVTDGNTGKPLNNATVFLLRATQDTLLGKAKASIYSSSDSSGRFRITNLAAGTYKLYAIKEKENGGDRIYQAATDAIGFKKEPIVLTKSVDSFKLSTFMEELPVFRISNSRLQDDGVIKLAFTKGLTRPAIRATGGPAGLRVLTRFSQQKDTALVFVNNYGFDSLKLDVTDSGKVLASTRIRREPTARYNLQLAITNNLQGGLVNPWKGLQLYLNRPLASINSRLITLTEDSVQVKQFTLQGDSSDVLKYTLPYDFKQGKQYVLTINANGLQGLGGGTNALTEIKFTPDKRENYGVLNIKFAAANQKHPYIIELLNARSTVLEGHPIKSGESVSFTNYPAGEYHIRVVYDTNGNGKWDTGNVKNGTQPERQFNVAKEMSIRANWDRNEIITVP